MERERHQDGESKVARPAAEDSRAGQPSNRMPTIKAALMTHPQAAPMAVGCQSAISRSTR